MERLFVPLLAVSLAIAGAAFAEPLLTERFALSFFLMAAWVLVLLVALFLFERRGLWFLLGAPLFVWQIAFVAFAMAY